MSRQGWRVMVVCLVGALGAPALARPGVDDALKRVEALVSELASAPAARRAELLDESIKARRELLALGANDDRLATWLLDQAEAELEYAGRDGAELSVLYGVPTSEQRSREKEAATHALELVDQSEHAATDAVARLEEEVFAARGNAEKVKKVSARVEPRMRVLVDVEQSWRIPMVRSRAMLVSAGLLEGRAGLEEQHKTGKSVAELLAAGRAPDGAGEASRQVWLATAEALGGQGREAMNRFAEVEGNAGKGMVGEQARLGLARAAVDLIAAREAARLLERGSAEAPAPLDLLRSEAVARSVLAHAAEAGEAAGSVQVEGLQGMARVVARSLSEPSDWLRAAAAEKTAILTEGVEMKQMEAPILYARGVALLEGWGTEKNEAAGVGLLKRVADEKGSGPIREAALWALGTRVAPGRSAATAQVDAAASLVRLENEFPESARAREALERADALLRKPAGAKDVAALALQRKMIEQSLALHPAPTNADELRSLRVANLALDTSATVDAAELERVLTGLPPWGAAQQERRAGDEQNAWIVIERVLAGAKGGTRADLAGVAVKWASARAPALAARARVVWGEALLEAGDAKKAVEQIAAIGPIHAAALTDEERVRARLTLGRAQRLSGDATAAFTTLRALADELDQEPAPGAPKRPAAFWAAWAEMLEILAGQNKDGARTPTMRLQINRLKLIDAGLGGEAWKGRIDKVGAELK